MTRSIALLFLLGLGVTAAAAQEPLPAQLGACLQITGMLQRLACYDRVAHAVSPAMGTVPAQRPAANTAPIVAAPPVAAAPTGLGSERLPRTASVVPKRSQELVAGVSDVSYDARGRFTVTLDNGQVWRQVEGDTAVLTGSRLPAVRIARGALGSYVLNIVGRNATYRVSRLQ